MHVQLSRTSAARPASHPRWSLRKLATGASWRSMTYSVGKWENASFAHYQLKRRFEGFLSQLRDLRSA